jgi:hypothetical protein
VYLAAPLLLCSYYAVVWLSIGPLRKLGTAVVRYQPPAGVSPAEARYLYTTGTESPDAGLAYLPYAIALEVREAWGDHLAGAFFAATVQR